MITTKTNDNYNYFITIIIIITLYRILFYIDYQ